MLEARQRPRLFQKARPPPLERLHVPLRTRAHGHAGVALAELVGEIFLDRDGSRQPDVLGLVGDAEAARADHFPDPVAAREDRIFRQRLTTIHGPLLRSVDPLDGVGLVCSSGTAINARAFALPRPLLSRLPNICAVSADTPVHRARTDLWEMVKTRATPSNAAQAPCSCCN
jgi:hypothetical protein